MKSIQNKTTHLLFWILLAAALYFRASGLFHGLAEGHVFHPDTPKQVMNLQQGLEGNHVTYHGNLFYDGYPYGLNRVDEAVLRTVRTLITPVHRLLYGQQHSLPLPDRNTLYYHARLLRLLYGMIAVLLLTKSAHLLTRSRFAALTVLALYAAAPLAATVTHSASGDIGVDLFVAFTLFSLALHTRNPKPRHLITAGLAVGMAFASKYQGALGAWIVAVYLLVLHPPLQKNETKPFFVKGFLSAFAFFLGVFLLTPGLWIDPSTTWKLMRKNFEFIKNYGVPPDFLDLPAHTRAFTGLTNNLPVVIQALGPLLLLAAVFSLILALKKLKNPAPPETRAVTGLWIAAASFPFLVILLSTAMKPMVQPFHFSFLLIPLIFSAGLFFHALHTRPKVSLTLPAVLWTLLIVFFATRTALQEDAFWRRPSITPLHNRYATHSTVKPLHISRDFTRTDGVKTFHLHPSGLPVFRNQSRILSAPHAEHWQTLHQLPVPTRPLTENPPAWIFLHGARFPNSDHAFRLPGDTPRRLQLVHNTPPPEIIHIGIRSGSRPVRVTARIGAYRAEANLPPHEQQILPLTLSTPRNTQPATDTHPRIYLHELHLHSAPGTAWIEIIRDQDHLRHYQTFGPRPADPPTPLDDRQKEMLAATRFLDSDLPRPVTSPSQSLFTDPEGLPAGSYRLEATLLNPGNTGADFTFTLGDPLTKSPALTPPSLNAAPGISTHRHLFHKPFAPFEVDLALHTLREDLTLLSWTLRTHAQQTPPEPAVPTVLPFQPLNIAYATGIHLTGIHLTFPPDPNAPLSWAVRAEIPPGLDLKTFRETVIFIHLLRPDGTLAQALDIPLEQATFNENRPRIHQAQSAPGLENEEKFTLLLGLYNPRTRLRLPPRVHIPAEARITRDALQLHTFTAPLQAKTLPENPIP